MPKSRSKKSIRKIRKTQKSVKRKRNIRYSFGNEKDEKELCIYFIAGLGCKYAEDELNELQEDIAKYAKIDLSDVKIICHDKHLAPIRGIFSSFLQERFDTTPMKNSSFLKRLEQDVKTQCELYKKVLIFGHSYGGLIANRLAEELNTQNTQNIQIATFGSIYIANPRNVDRINIVNYQSIGDISARFKSNAEKNVSYDELTFQIKGIYNDMISFSREKDSKNVIYICVSTQENPNCVVKNKGFFGLAGDEWDIHNNYLDLIIILSHLHSNVIII